MANNKTIVCVPRKNNIAIKAITSSVRNIPKNDEKIARIRMRSVIISAPFINNLPDY